MKKLEPGSAESVSSAHLFATFFSSEEMVSFGSAHAEFEQKQSQLRRTKTQQQRPGDFQIVGTRLFAPFREDKNDVTYSSSTT